MKDADFKPITPEEAQKKRVEAVPYFVIKVINTMLAKEFTGWSVTFKVEDMAEAIMKGAQDRDMNPGGFLTFKDMQPSSIYDNRWLSDETLRGLYGPHGWSIESDYPGFNESYDATVTFRKKK